MAKKFSEAFYKSKEWKKCRKAYIESVHGLCESCLDKGIIKNGYILHHTEKLTPFNINDVNVTLNWDKLKYKCLECHNEDEQGEHGNGKPKVKPRYMYDEQGNIYPI